MKKEKIDRDLKELKTLETKNLSLHDRTYHDFRAMESVNQRLRNT